jgi:hypothetical protein
MHLPSLLRVVACVPLLASCSDGRDVCDCAPPGLGIEIPDDRASDVAAVRWSGPPCDGQRPSCTGGGPCNWGFDHGVADGVCHIEVSFRSGAPTFTADVSFHTNVSDCCPGIYPDRRVVVVPAASPSSDAGTRDAR